MPSKKSVERIKTPKEDSDYERQIRKIEKENKRLKAEIRSLQETLAQADDYIFNMIQDKTVEEVMKDVKENTDVTVQEKCPNCGTHEMKKINLGSIKIITCTKCPYRNRINESEQA